MEESMSRKKKAKSAKQASKEITVYIYESEYCQIQAWVARYQNLETGGDLFGLWADDHTAVVQLVLGPGKNCSRTQASFYQDIEYLERVGNKLTNEEGLCHIGEWHSHHRLGLKEPSGGDKNTVWTNMKKYGINRFLLFIATIDGSWSCAGTTPHHVSVNGFHFMTTINKRRLSECKFIPVDTLEKSPFRLKYNDEINEGVESVNDEKMIQVLVGQKKTKAAEREASEAKESPPDSGEPEGKKVLEHSWLTRFFNLILYVCCPVWLRCKRWCSVLGRCICWCMWLLIDKGAEDTKPTEPVKNLIHLCCPICWFIPKHRGVKT